MSQKIYLKVTLKKGIRNLQEKVKEAKVASITLEYLKPILRILNQKSLLNFKFQKHPCNHDSRNNFF